MKLKIVGLAVLLSLYYSCGSSSSTVATTPTSEPKNVAEASAPVAVSGPIAMTAEMAAGKAAYENHCAKCHRLFEAKEYSKEQWAPILVRMQKKSHLDDAEMAPINNYIYSQL